MTAEHKPLARYWRKLERGDAYGLTDDAPDWLTDAVHDAHNGMAPDDTMYEWCRDACAWIDEHDGAPDKDRIGEVCDPDYLMPYTRDRLAWLASRLDRCATVDEACEELGYEGHDISARIGLGIAHEAEHAYRAILSAWEEARDAEPDADTED